MKQPVGVRVRLGKRSYPIWIGSQWLSGSAPRIRQATRARTFLVLSTGRILGFHGPALKRSLRRLGQVHLLTVPDGEAAKNEHQLLRILRFLAEKGFQRDACLVTLGGGVVGDLGGLASALYMRGIDFIQVPTTLLAQVDASVGGKTAIDFHGVKNLIGAFHQPRTVLIDTAVLRTLPARVYRAGLAEVVKHGVIRDAAFFRWLENHVVEIVRRDPLAVAHMVRRSCEIKAAVVRMDERESGLRACLNFGHTLGHALESLRSSQGLQHGEAVAYGMVGASGISAEMGLCPEDVPARIQALLERLGLLKPLPQLDPGRILRLLSFDKKARAGKALFVLTRKMGAVSMNHNVPNRLILRALRHLQAPRPDVSGPA